MKKRYCDDIQHYIIEMIETECKPHLYFQKDISYILRGGKLTEDRANKIAWLLDIKEPDILFRVDEMHKLETRLQKKKHMRRIKN